MKDDTSGLFERLSRDDTTALYDLYVKYAPKVRYFAFGILKDKEDAEDIIQDVFLKIWKNRKKESKVISEESYIIVMAKNMIMNLLKKRKRHFGYVEFTMTTHTMYEQENVTASDLLEKIEKSISEMPKQRREVFEKSRFQEKTYKEISVETGISPKTVQYHISNALSTLKKLF